MKSKKPSRRGSSSRQGRSNQRKAYQLCGQVSRTLSYVLAGECDDDIFRNLYVVSVTPAPDATRLLVTVAEHQSGVTPAHELVARLQQISGKLRIEIAADINRRRTPELVFCVANSLAEAQTL